MDWTPEAISWIVAGLLPLIVVAFWPIWALPWMLYAGYYFWRHFLHKTYLEPAGKAVYVTGCDSGFGFEVAQSLAHDGFLVFAGCLQPNGTGAQKLKDSCGGNVEILDLDVTSAEKVQQCAERIEAVCNDLGMDGLWGLYNNAGIATAAEIEFCPMEVYMKQADVNLWGVVRVTKSVLPLIRASKGRVVTVSSGISRYAMNGRSPYCISKYGVEAFMDALRLEMAKFGVKCCTIAPGNFTGVTNIFESLSASIDQVYRKMKQTIKVDYGEEYLTAFKDSIVGRYRSQGAPKSIGIDKVVQSIKDALTEESPRTRYKPMQPGWLVWSFFTDFLPHELLDRYSIYLMRNMPKPKIEMDKLN